MIKTNLSKAYKKHYMFDPLGTCEGCESEPGTNTAHIIPKAILKTLGLTSLIWNPELWFRACIGCNLIAENPASVEITKLKNFDRIKEVTEKYDPQRASKFICQI